MKIIMNFAKIMLFGICGLAKDHNWTNDLLMKTFVAKICIFRNLRRRRFPQRIENGYFLHLLNFSWLEICLFMGVGTVSCESAMIRLLQCNISKFKTFVISLQCYVQYRIFIDLIARKNHALTSISVNKTMQRETYIFLPTSFERTHKLSRILQERNKLHFSVSYTSKIL